jgi:hypothetical protein
MAIGGNVIDAGAQRILLLSPFAANGLPVASDENVIENE